MPLIGTKAAASSQGFGQFAESGAEPVYIENVFSTYLYTGNGSTQTITNGIDLAGEGGLVWIKSRANGYPHNLQDTVRGYNKFLNTNNTQAQSTGFGEFASFNSDGFSLGPVTVYNGWNTSGDTYVSWTFRKQPKFFDVVTVTGQATQTTFNHNLGSVPGCIIIKCTNSTGDWFVYHRSTGSSQYLVLNSTSAQAAYTNWCVATSTTVTVLGGVMGNANSFVVYLFAHDAGGFGLEGTDNVISCGSYTGNGSATGPVITLGYEPQWVLIKNTSAAQNWYLLDNMRGMPVGSADANLIPNTSNAESNSTVLSPTATGFQLDTTGSPNQSGDTFIYIAIRRGPMKVPTSGTEVYTPIARTGTSAAAIVTTGFPVDMVAVHMRNSTNNEYVADRLRGGGLSLEFRSTAAETDRSAGGITSIASNTGFSVGVYSDVNSSPNTYINWCFRRAPGFFDVVCYTGTGVNSRAINHNLGVAPEFIIVKRRNGTGSWYTYINGYNNFGGCVLLNTTGVASGVSQGDVFGYSGTTSTTFQAYVSGYINSGGDTFVAYLFATVAGVSKVGIYTGTGSAQVVNCGFTNGSRFVLTRRITGGGGSWYVWDSARGIVAGNDPYLLLNSTATEVTNTDYIDTASTGFEISSTAPAEINASGSTYIFLAIA